MSTYLPLFPLQLVVFPGERLNLHIFEERYKQLISETYNSNSTFGIPTFNDEEILEYGTEVEVLSIEKVYPDGKMDIKTKGLRTFKVLEYKPKAENALYPAGFVEFTHDFVHLSDKNVADTAVQKELESLLLELGKALDLSKKIIPSRRENMSLAIAHYLGMDLMEEYKLLITPEENERQKILIEYLEKAIPDIKKREVMKSKIALNGHFKNIKPPKI